MSIERGNMKQTALLYNRKISNQDILFQINTLLFYIAETTHLK